MNYQRKVAEYRATVKGLEEQRAELKTQLEEILNKAKQENRAVTKEESETFDTLEQKIKDIDATLELEKRARKIGEPTERTKQTEEPQQQTEVQESEIRAFTDYIRGIAREERADVNFTVGQNGAIIPTSIANKIIEKVKDICPIYEMATKYHVKGTLVIPYYDESTQEITMSYSEEFAELESTSGKFTSISLGNFLAGVLTKISKSLLNNNNFNLFGFIVQKVAEAAKKWIEKELLLGTEGKIEGLKGVNQVVEAKSATAITVDDLMDTQDEVPDTFQSGAIWIMNRKTRNTIRKLKDSDGNYLLNRDVSSKWGYTLLGKDVYTTDTMPKIEAGETVIYYGDMTGLAVKISEDVSVEVLREKFATQHAYGVVAWLEMDAKVENAQKISVLRMKAA